MKDPHIHVEKNLTWTHAKVRAVITDVTGLGVDAPTTVTTGCSKRRPYAMTSARPESVTCAACRDFARQKHTEAAEMIEVSRKHCPVEHQHLGSGEAAAEIARRP